MMTLVKKLAKTVLPASARLRLRRMQRDYQIAMARRAFEAASSSSSYLGMEELAAMQKEYPFPAEYPYDPAALEARGIERSAKILALPGAKSANAFLELGCWDGMVSACLSKQGKMAAAIDNRDIGFDARATQMGAKLMQMDASRLEFADETFDYIFSFDSAEHFPAPDRVLQEATRVLKPRGYILLEFGPLYYSPFGEHAYRSVTVPYCQFLFSKDTISQFTAKNGLTPIDFNHVNGWSLDAFRALWEANTSTLEIISNREDMSAQHVNLIRRFPSLFKSRSPNFENFIISNISILLRKTGASSHPRP